MKQFPQDICLQLQGYYLPDDYYVWDILQKDETLQYVCLYIELIKRQCDASRCSSQT